jgi:hypothetical protein
MSTSNIYKFVLTNNKGIKTFLSPNIDSNGNIDNVSNISFNNKTLNHDNYYCYCSFTASSNTQIGGSITGDSNSVNYNTSSDGRLKKSITPLITGDCLDNIEKLVPVRYSFINDINNKLYEGFIADEVESIFPHAVTGNIGETMKVDGVDGEPYTIIGVSGKTYDVISVNGETISVDAVSGETYTILGISGETYDVIVPQQLDYTKIIASLVGSIKELNIKVTDLNNRITLLENNC